MSYCNRVNHEHRTRSLSNWNRMNTISKNLHDCCFSSRTQDESHNWHFCNKLAGVQIVQPFESNRSIRKFHCHTLHTMINSWGLSWISLLACKYFWIFAYVTTVFTATTTCHLEMFATLTSQLKAIVGVVEILYYNCITCSIACLFACGQLKCYNLQRC